jgi:hypothetical protein
MRILLVLVVLSAVGCNSGNDGLGVGGGGGADGGGGGDDAAVTADLAMPTPDLGGSGAACKTACDCQTGLACFMGACTQSPVGMLYCCESATCPSGGYCQSMSGQFQMCGGGPIVKPDGGFHFDGGIPKFDGGFPGFPDGGFKFDGGIPKFDFGLPGLPDLGP